MQELDDGLVHLAHEESHNEHETFVGYEPSGQLFGSVQTPKGELLRMKLPGQDVQPLDDALTHVRHSGLHESQNVLETGEQIPAKY